MKYEQANNDPTGLSQEEIYEKLQYWSSMWVLKRTANIFGGRDREMQYLATNNPEAIDNLFSSVGLLIYGYYEKATSDF